MSQFSDNAKQYHKERVREVLVLYPRATVKQIIAVLAEAKEPLILSDKYIGKVITKIHGERLTRFDRSVLKTAIAEMEDRKEAVVSQMWKILYNPKHSAKDRVMAGKVIVDAEKNLLEAKMDAGIFDRKIGTLDVHHEHTVNLPDEIRLPILRAFRNYGIIRPSYTVLPAEPTAAGNNIGGGT
jgi:hypothetical protein